MCNEWSIEFLKSCIENVYDAENLRELTPEEPTAELEIY